MDFLDFLRVLFGIHDLTLEYLMTDHAGLFSILLFMGGVFFWFMVLCGIVLGVCRGIKRLYDSARDIFGGRGRFNPAE